MRPFSLLVKPVGSACNLACPYCFYRGHGSSARMDEGWRKFFAHATSYFRELVV